MDFVAVREMNSRINSGHRDALEHVGNLPHEIVGGNWG